MLKVKGAAVKSTITLIKEKLGDDLQEWVDTLPDDLKFLFTRPLLTSQFYDTVTLATLMERYAEYRKEDPERVYIEMGHASADYGLKTVHRVFLKLGSPEFLIRKSSVAWNSYYDAGVMEVVSHSPGSASLNLSGVKIPHRAICGRITGWMERYLELTGARNINLRHTRCTVKGDPREEWEADWN